MSTYKVIQDVEAEDKILGPLTLRQFIYAGIAAICLYLTYFMSTHGAAFMAAILVPIALVVGFFAIPWGRDQPTEVWALARIRYIMKPRRRIWNQSGVKELVTITAPKRRQEAYTDGLTQTEVKSRLHALADTLDSRGWAVKNSAVNLYSEPALVMGEPNDQERLLTMADMPQQQTPIDVHDADDMLDEQNNPAAQQMDSMINASAKAHRQKIIDTLNEPAAAEPTKQEHSRAPTNDYWFLNQQSQATAARVSDDMVTFNTQVVTPGMGSSQKPAMPAPVATPAPNEQELVEELEARKQQLPMTAYYGHLHTIQPLSAQQEQAQARRQQQTSAGQVTPQDGYVPKIGGPFTSQQATQNDSNSVTTPVTDQPGSQPANNTTQNQPEPDVQPVTPAQQAAILQLANNDDLNVATLAREAQRSEAADGEVVIKLH
jgi:hypothetical protein